MVLAVVATTKIVPNKKFRWLARAWRIIRLQGDAYELGTCIRTHVSERAAGRKTKNRPRFKRLTRKCNISSSIKLLQHYCAALSVSGSYLLAVCDTVILTKKKGTSAPKQASRQRDCPPWPIHERQFWIFKKVWGTKFELSTRLSSKMAEKTEEKPLKVLRTFLEKSWRSHADSLRC